MAPRPPIAPVFLPHAHGLARDVSFIAEQPGEQHRRQVPLVDVHRAQARPEHARGHVPVRAGDQAHRRVEQGGGDGGQVIGTHEGIAVGHHQVFVAGLGEHVDEVADLVSCCRAAEDRRPRRSAVPGTRRSAARPRRSAGSCRIAHAEDDLILGIVLLAERAQVLVQARLRAAQRLEHGYRRLRGRDRPRDRRASVPRRARAASSTSE